MPRHKQQPSKNADTGAYGLTTAEQNLLKALRSHKQGLKSRELVKEMTGLGYSEYVTQRAIQRALDRGALELGRKLRLFSAAG
jgi:hypothetical protein